jgi:hypothetical protein
MSNKIIKDKQVLKLKSGSQYKVKEKVESNMNLGPPWIGLFGLIY